MAPVGPSGILKTMRSWAPTFVLFARQDSHACAGALAFTIRLYQVHPWLHSHQERIASPMSSFAMWPYCLTTIATLISSADPKKIAYVGKCVVLSCGTGARQIECRLGIIVLIKIPSAVGCVVSRQWEICHQEPSHTSFCKLCLRCRRGGFRLRWRAGETVDHHRDEI
jgi:hypothetical protein